MKADQQKTILMLIPDYGFGGAQRVFSLMANMLASDYKIIKVVFNNDLEEVYPSNGENLSLDVKAGKNIILKTVQFIKRCWKLHQLRNQYAVDYSISHLEGANFVNILSFGKGKTILCVHGSKTVNDRNRKGFVKIIENHLFIPCFHGLADKIIPVSQGIATELIDVFKIKKKKIQVIHNGLDTITIEEMSNEKLSSEEEKLFNQRVIVYFGRLAAEKNLLSLIDIYAGLDFQKKVRLILIGDGPEKNKLIEHCRQKQLTYQEGLKEECDANVIFLGFLNNPFKLVKKAALSIFTSYYEGFPLSHCESIVCGTPVIASDCPAGGSREVIAPDSKITINPNLKHPENADCGTLMPVPSDEKSVKLWSRELSFKITDDEWQNTLSKALEKRAHDLTISRYKDGWLTLLSQMQ